MPAQGHCRQRAGPSRFRLDRAHSLETDRDDVRVLQLRTATGLDPAVDLHRAVLDEVPRMHAVLGEQSELEELTEPDRQLGNRDIPDRWARHAPIIARLHSAG